LVSSILKAGIVAGCAETCCGCAKPTQQNRIKERMRKLIVMKPVLKRGRCYPYSSTWGFEKVVVISMPLKYRKLQTVLFYKSSPA
jgi:hypothetical protein